MNEWDLRYTLYSSQISTFYSPFCAPCSASCPSDAGSTRRTDRRSFRACTCSWLHICTCPLRWKDIGCSVSLWSKTTIPTCCCFDAVAVVAAADRGREICVLMRVVGQWGLGWLVWVQLPSGPWTSRTVELHKNSAKENAIISVTWLHGYRNLYKNASSFLK